MNAIARFSESTSAVALTGARIIPFAPRPAPEIITGLGQYRAGAGRIVTDWCNSEEEARDEFDAMADEIEAAIADTLAEIEAEDREPEEDAAPEPVTTAPLLPTSAVVDRDALTRAFDIVWNTVERRNTIPILSNARMVGDGKSLAVTGTDLDLEITVSVEAAADAEFAITLPAATLRDLLKKASASDLVAFTDHRDGTATADFERVEYKLQSLPVADFPNLTVGDGSHAFTLPGAVFWSGIDSTMAAVSKEETRYYLNGIYLHAHDAHHWRYDDATAGMVEDGGGMVLRMVATDGHRLYRQDVAAPEGCEGMPGIIVPAKTVAVLHKLMKGKTCPDLVAVDLSDTRIRFRFGNVTLVSKLIDGTFPDYQRVIPSMDWAADAGAAKRATFDPETLLEAVRAVTLISSERGRAVKLTMSEGACELSVNNPDQGSARSSIVCGFDGPAGFEIGYNAGYLVDAVATATMGDDDVVTWQGTDYAAPAIITGSREGWMAVLMPMRV